MGAAQDSKPLPESLHSKELRYVEYLEEVKAKLILLEQNLADQPGNEEIQNSLASAKFQQGNWEACLGSVQRLREFFPRVL